MIGIKFGYVIEYKAKLTKYQHSWLQKLLTKKKLITTYKVVIENYSHLSIILWWIRGNSGNINLWLIS